MTARDLRDGCVVSGAKQKPVELFTVKAWSANAIAFIEERGLTREFSDWCGGWPCPVSPEAVVAAPCLAVAGASLLASLDPETLNPEQFNAWSELSAALAKIEGDA